MLRIAAVCLAVAMAIGLLPASHGASAEPMGDLVAVWSKDSLAFHHELFEQRIGGVPVAGASLAVHTAHDGDFEVRHDNLYRGAAPTGSFALPPIVAAAAAESATGASAVATRQVYAPVGEGLIAAYEVTIESLHPVASSSVMINAVDGAVVSVQDRLLRAAVPARVFQVNPIVGMQNGSFEDNQYGLHDDTFADAYVDVVHEGVTGPRLENDRLAVADSGPAAGVHGENRDDPRFLESMAYHWLNVAFAELDAAGYGGLIDTKVNIVSHLPYPLVDGFTINKGLIVMGYRGGTSFASTSEDAEFLIHEFGHVMHLHAAPQVEMPTFAPDGSWQRTWAEGTADLFAALVLEPYSGGFGDPCMFEWMTAKQPGYGFEWNDLACMRILDNNFTVEDGYFRMVNSHHHAQYWTGAVWDIRGALGRNATLQLFMESTYLASPAMASFQDIADAWMAADQGLSGGANARLIADSFAGHGINVTDAPVGEPAAMAHEATKDTPAIGLWVIVGVLVVAVAARRR